MGDRLLGLPSSHGSPGPPVTQVMPGPLHSGSPFTLALSPPAAVLVSLCTLITATTRPLRLPQGQGSLSACLLLSTVCPCLLRAFQSWTEHL